MNIITIHSVSWQTPDHKLVLIVADTDEKLADEIWTPYSNESIFWEELSVFPIDQISEYVAPPEEPAPSEEPASEEPQS